MTSWKALTIHMESDDGMSSSEAMLGRATLHIVPSRTERKSPQNVAAMA